MFTRRSSIPVMGAIPPGVRLGLGLRLGISIDPSMGTGTREFKPTVVQSGQPVLGARQGVSDKIKQLDKALEGVLAEALGDKYLQYEVDLLKAEIAALKERL